MDAICLALYNNTPRFKQAATGNYYTRLADKTETLDVSKVYQLMRRNTGEAMVELNFIGSDDEEYLASWYINRGRKKATEPIHKVKWSLTNLKTQQSWNSYKSIDAEIILVVGLDF